MSNTFQNLQKEIDSRFINLQRTQFQFEGKQYDASFAVNKANQNKRPGIIILPEWWGLNDYVKTRAKMLATLGYAALAIDVFGNGETASNPAEAMAYIKPYNDDSGLAGKIVQAAIEKLTSFPEVDPERIAVIGYCFGGFAAILAGLSGINIKAVAAFHPSLGGIKATEKVPARFLICNGADDDFEIDNFESFKNEMDKAGIDYEFHVYPGAKHAFTSPGADENGKEFGIPVAYQEEADAQSWNDMKEFFKKYL